MRDLTRMLAEDSSDIRIWLWKRELYHAKEAGAVPHDVGAPREDPFAMCNSYTWQNSNVWRDLNADYVLLLYRDVTFTGDRVFLRACWPGVQMAMARLGSYDSDGDGLIENIGTPDQTFDNIPFLGGA